MARARVKRHTRRTKSGRRVSVGASTRTTKGRTAKKAPRALTGVKRVGKTLTKKTTAKGTKSPTPNAGKAGGTKQTRGPRQTARAAAHATAFAKKTGAEVAKAARSKGSHTGAGLKRLGKTGNRYTDETGAVFHRVGRGKKSEFRKGEPPKSPKRAKVKKREEKKPRRKRR